MRASELRALDDAQLIEAMRLAKKENMLLRIQRSQDATSVKTHQFGILRKRIARIQTLLVERKK